MTLIKRNNSFFNDFPRLFDDLFGNDLFDWRRNNFSSTSTTVPSVNIKETEDAYQVELAAPGMDKSDFNIDLNGNVLTIKSSKKMENEVQEEHYRRREFSYQSFQRSFSLPDNVVDPDQIKASYDKGLLTINIPKVRDERSKLRKQIEIG